MSSAISRRHIDLRCDWRNCSSVPMARCGCCLPLLGRKAMTRATVIDHGLGWAGRPGCRSRPAPFTAAQMKDVRGSGLTCAHTTVGVVRDDAARHAAYVEVVRSILWI